MILKKWLRILHSEKVSINRPTLKKRDHDFANEFNIESFEASDIWMKKWKERCVYIFDLLCILIYFRTKC